MPPRTLYNNDYWNGLISLSHPPVNFYAQKVSGLPSSYGGIYLITVQGLIDIQRFLNVLMDLVGFEAQVILIG